MKRKPDQRERALRAYRLSLKNITGEELAAKLKTNPDHAADLVRVGKLIVQAESHRLSQATFDRLQVIARVMVRKTMHGIAYVKTSEVDFAAGKRSGWCGKALVDLASRNLILMPAPGRIEFTPAGWTLVWEAKLITPTWKVPA